jgi:hypothetical protein
LDDPFPNLINPDAVALVVVPLLVGAEGVQVGAEVALAPLSDLDVAVLIAGVDGVALKPVYSKFRMSATAFPLHGFRALNRWRISLTWA